MPISIEQHDGLVWVAVSGMIEQSDLVHLAAEMSRVEAGLTPLPSRVGDLTGMTGLNVQFSAASRVSEARRAQVLPNPIRSAIVANGPVQVGFARMLQLLLSNPQITHRLFDDRDAATAWARTGVTPDATQVR